MFYYLSSDTIADKSLEIFGVMMMFGAPFIAICYCVGYLFNKADSAFKYSVIVMLGIYGFPYLVGAIYGFITSDDGTNSVILVDTCSYISPPALLMQSMALLMGS